MAVAAGVMLAPQQSAHALTATDTETLARVSAYLNGMSSMRASFAQVSSTGAHAEGSITLRRPGRMRLDYDPPTPVLVIADGESLIYVDEELDQITHLDLEDTPAGVLVRDDLKLGEDSQVSVTNVSYPPGQVEVSVVLKAEPDAGAVTLVFDNQPLLLRQWRMRDAQGTHITVTLFDLEQGVDAPDRLFRVRDRRFFENGAFPD